MDQFANLSDDQILIKLLEMSQEQRNATRLHSHRLFYLNNLVDVIYNHFVRMSMMDNRKALWYMLRMSPEERDVTRLIAGRVVQLNQRIDRLGRVLGGPRLHSTLFNSIPYGGSQNFINQFAESLNSPPSQKLHNFPEEYVCHSNGSTQSTVQYPSVAHKEIFPAQLNPIANSGSQNIIKQTAKPLTYPARAIQTRKLPTISEMRTQRPVLSAYPNVGLLQPEPNQNTAVAQNISIPARKLVNQGAVNIKTPKLPSIPEEDVKFATTSAQNRHSYPAKSNFNSQNPTIGLPASNFHQAPNTTNIGHPSSRENFVQIAPAPATSQKQYSSIDKPNFDAQNPTLNFGLPTSNFYQSPFTTNIQPLSVSLGQMDSLNFQTPLPMLLSPPLSVQSVSPNIGSLSPNLQPSAEPNLTYPNTNVHCLAPNIPSKTVSAVYSTPNSGYTIVSVGLPTNQYPTSYPIVREPILNFVQPFPVPYPMPIAQNFSQNLVNPTYNGSLSPNYVSQTPNASGLRCNLSLSNTANLPTDKFQHLPTGYPANLLSPVSSNTYAAY